MTNFENGGTGRLLHNPAVRAVVIGGIFYLLGQYIASQPQRAEQEVAAQREITVQGSGEVTAVPDIAVITLGVTTGTQPTAEAATRRLSSASQAIVQAVKGFDIDEEDITTTNVSVNPIYDFREGQRVPQGFEASQSLRVKIRELDSIGNIIAATTQEGVNQIGGIAFEIDDPEELQRAAQEKAIADAQENAKQLARALDVQLGRVKSFAENGSTPPIPPTFARASLEVASDELSGPVVPEGSQDISTTVTITYELR